MIALGMLTLSLGGLAAISTLIVRGYKNPRRPFKTTYIWVRGRLVKLES